jgi:hypothetical protein
VQAVRKYPEKAQMSIALVIHPAKIIFQVLDHAAVGTGDKTQIHQEIITELKLILGNPGCAKQDNHEKNQQITSDAQKSPRDPLSTTIMRSIY